VLAGRGLCDELITRPEESYRLWCVDVCDIEKITLVNGDEGQDPLRGYRAKRKKMGGRLRYRVCKNFVCITRHKSCELQTKKNGVYEVFCTV
jgi:hypothetical protein